MINDINNIIYSFLKWEDFFKIVELYELSPQNIIIYIKSSLELDNIACLRRNICKLKYDQIDVLKIILNKTFFKISFDNSNVACVIQNIKLAIKHNNIKIIMYLFKQINPYLGTSYAHTVVELFEYSIEYSTQICANYFYLKIQYKNSIHPFWSILAIHNNIKMVRYMYEIIHLQPTKEDMEWASKLGKYDIVKYLCEKNVSISEHAIHYAGVGKLHDHAKILMLLLS
jgi:hypothetical protein